MIILTIQETVFSKYLIFDSPIRALFFVLLFCPETKRLPELYLTHNFTLFLRIYLCHHMVMCVGRQLLVLYQKGISPDHIYIDKQSGKDFNRPGYRRMLRQLRENDVVYIKSIDRLGRNYQEIQKEWRRLVQDKKVDIVVLDMPLLDTRSGKDLLGTFMSDIVLQILSFVAENERTNIRERQAEGIMAARTRGVRFGRPAKPLNDGFYRAADLWSKGCISCAEAARLSGVSESTFRRKAAQLYEAAPPDQPD